MCEFFFLGKSSAETVLMVKKKTFKEQDLNQIQVY